MHSIWFWTYQHENYLRPTTFYRTSEVMYYKTMMLQKIFLSEFDQIVCWFWMLDEKKSKAGRQKYILVYSNWDILPFIRYTAVPTNAAGWQAAAEEMKRKLAVYWWDFSCFWMTSKAFFNYKIYWILKCLKKTFTLMLCVLLAHHGKRKNVRQLVQKSKYRHGGHHSPWKVLVVLTEHAKKSLPLVAILATSLPTILVKVKLFTKQLGSQLGI